jgi:glycosyltransferase involved in cell wall biosynthesis
LIELLENKGIDFVYPVSHNWGFSWSFTCGWSTWITDLQHKYLPTFFSSKEIKHRDNVFKYLSDNSLNIVFSSKNVLSNFSTFYPECKAQKFVLNFRTFPDQNWFESYLDPALVQGKYNLPNKFFLVSNQFWIHKNHKLIIEALIFLKRINVKPIIICTGKLHDSRFTMYGEEIKTLIEKNSLIDQFIILGLIPRWDQIQLMRRSLAVIQPSLFEGWSTVVEDARLLGKTILLSDLPVHREQNPLGAIFFKPDSSQELANHLESLIDKLNPGPDLIAETESRVRNQLDCQKYAEQFLNIVQKIVS